MIGEEILNRLITEYKNTEKGILVASTDGKRGHPLIFDSKYIQEILSYGAGESLRDLLEKHKDDVAELETGSPEILRDIDTEQDYQNELKLR
jgi:molybdenum cofactor cytidylyltransferase